MLIVLLELYLKNKATQEIELIALSTHGYVTRPTDDPPSKPYLNVLSQAGDIARGVYSDGRTGGATEQNKGAITVRNEDREFSYLAAYGQDGRRGRVLTAEWEPTPEGGWDWPAYADFVVRQDGLLLVSEETEGELHIRFRDKQRETEGYIQASKYLGTNQPGSFAGREGKADTIMGRPKPQAFGESLECTGQPANDAALVDQFHDGRIADIPELYEGGVPLTKVEDLPGPGEYCVLRQYGCTLRTTPASKQLTARVLGDESEGDRYSIADDTISVARVATGSISISVDAAEQKFVRGSGSFVTDGFHEGDPFQPASFSESANNGTGVVVSVAALELFVRMDETALVDEASGTRSISGRWYYADSGSGFLGAGFVDGDHVKASGFGQALNSGRANVTTATAARLYVDRTLATESAGADVVIAATGYVHRIADIIERIMRRQAGKGLRTSAEHRLEFDTYGTYQITVPTPAPPTIRIKVWGAAGGGAEPSDPTIGAVARGGNGAYMAFTLVAGVDYVAGDVIEVQVGEGGRAGGRDAPFVGGRGGRTDGVQTGGDGGDCPTGATRYGAAGGGGGLTRILINGNPIAFCGAGGGGMSAGPRGGHGGTDTGGNGSSLTNGGDGKGGSLVGGGAAGAAVDDTPSATAGASEQGGDGGDGQPAGANNAGNSGAGGGGGAGFYGGGGGGHMDLGTSSIRGGGGAGGSTFINPAFGINHVRLAGDADGPGGKGDPYYLVPSGCGGQTRDPWGDGADALVVVLWDQDADGSDDWRDTVSFTAVNAAAPGSAGIFIADGDRRTIREAIDRLANSARIIWYYSRAGIFTLKQLGVPAGTPEATYRDWHAPLQRLVTRDDESVPAYRCEALYAYKNTTQTRDQLAENVDEGRAALLRDPWQRDAADEDLDVYDPETMDGDHLLSKPLVRETCYVQRRRALAEAVALQALYGARRDSVVITLDLVETLAREIGDLVAIEAAVFDYDAGAGFWVLAIEENFLTNRGTLILWAGNPDEWS